MEEGGLSCSQGIHRMVFASLFRWPHILEVFFMGLPRCRDDEKAPSANYLIKW